MIGIKDKKKNPNNFKRCDFSSYEVLIHKHTIRKDKGTKDNKGYGEKSKNH